MQLVGVRGQTVQSPLYDFSGTVTSGGTAQLVLASQWSRSYLVFQNISSANMYLWIGGPTATATISNGAVSGISVTNAGFNYTLPPIITLIGGGYSPSYSGVPDGLTFYAPSGFSHTNTAQTATLLTYRPATAHCVMTGAAGAQTISSITIDDGGAGYISAPYVFIQNDPRDPFGSGVPSTSAGIVLAQNGSFVMESSVVTTDSVAVYGGTTGQGFVCKVML